MARFTMMQLLTKHGLEGQIKNYQVVHPIVVKLRAEGYTQKLQKVNGKLQRMWGNDWPVVSEEQAAELKQKLDAALAEI